jgi:TonB-dependent starch-binding outer membrane protein SusC
MLKMKQLPIWRTTLLLMVAVLFSSLVYAQSRTVKGKITSTEDGTALPGVNITVKGTSTGTITDVDGNYSLNVPSNDAVLVFSYVGFVTQEVVVGTNSTLDVKLVTDTETLSEVVVVGYGTVKKKDLTGAIVQVSAKDFNPGVNPNPLQAIQGRVAGLNITQTSGDPTSSPTVRLRGYTSLGGGSEPLYVVDGVIGVPINSISPNDIETIDVLKDASAAAIYGARGANGVIAITTKRGKEGRTTVSVNNFIAVNTVSRWLDMLDADGWRAEVRRTGRTPGTLDQGANTNWLDEISRTGITTNNNISFTGGGPTFSYRGSLDRINNEGVMKNSGEERTTARINLDQKALNNKLSIQYSLSYSNFNQKFLSPDIIRRATQFLPTLPIRGSNGDYYEVPGSFDLFNPVAMLENVKNDGRKQILIGDITMRYEVTPGLFLGVKGSINNETENRNFAENGAIKAYSPSQGAAGRNYRFRNNRLMEFTANYVKTFGDNRLNAIAGYSYQDIIEDGFSAANNNFITTAFGYNNLGQGAGTLINPGQGYVSSGKGRTTLISFFGRATYDIGDKFNVTATLRRDGSSKFGADSKWGLFPAVAAGVNLTNFGFMKGITAINYAKLRVGWGQTGNSEGIAAYRSLELYNQSGTYYDGRRDDFLPGYAINQNPNPNLRWEVVEQANVGLDFELFGGKVSGTLEVYNKSTKNLLFNYNVPVPPYRVNTLLANVGTMRNRGFEFSLGGDVIRKDDFSWNTRVVGSMFATKVVSLSSGEFQVGLITYNSFGGRGLSDVWASTLREDKPFGQFLIPRFAGFSDAGLMQLENPNGGAPVTNYNRDILFESGDALPRRTASWINNFAYKAFTLSFQLRTVWGNKLLNNQRSNFMIPGSILETNMLRDISTMPANYGVNQLSDFWLESGAFVRMDNWQIGYNLPIKGKTFSNAFLYLSGNNLFVITGYKGIDPEIEVKGDLQDSGNSQRPNNIGLDTGIYPKTRTFSMGLNLSF